MVNNNFENMIADGNISKCVATIYVNDEPIAEFKLDIGVIDEYDDEIIIYSDNNDFVVLDNSNIIENVDEFDETEFIFGSDGHKIGIVFI